MIALGTLRVATNCFFAVLLNWGAGKPTVVSTRFGSSPVRQCETLQFWRRRLLQTRCCRSGSHPDGRVKVPKLVDVNYPDRSATTILAGGSGE